MAGICLIIDAIVTVLFGAFININENEADILIIIGIFLLYLFIYASFFFLYLHYTIFPAAWFILLIITNMEAKFDRIYQNTIIINTNNDNNRNKTNKDRLFCFLFFGLM